MTKQYLTKQVSWSGEAFLSEYERVAKDIKDRISNSLKVFYKWIKNKMRKGIINY